MVFCFVCILAFIYFPEPSQPTRVALDLQHDEAARPPAAEIAPRRVSVGAAGTK